MTEQCKDPNSDYFVAVDGGGSGLRLALLSASGQRVGMGRGGPANLNEVGPEGVARSLQTAWDAASRGRASMHRVAGLYMGLAGVGSQADRERVLAAIEALEICAPAAIEIGDDMTTMQVGAFMGGDGIVIMSGTGSFVFGKRGQHSARAGGGGPFLDDLGSGHEIARRALSCALRAQDGREPRSSMTDELQATVDWPRARAGQLERAEVAAFAPFVMQAARAGERPALQLIEDGADELCRMAVAVARSLDDTQLPFALCGGLFSGGPLYSGLLESRIRESLPSMVRCAPRGDALDGASLLVRRAITTG